MILKIVLICLVIFMIYNLFLALRMMIRNDPEQASMSKFIGRRLMFSILIVVLVIIGVATGLITPNTPPY